VLHGMWITMKRVVFRSVRKFGKKKVTVSFVMSVRPSVRPNGTTQLPLDGFYKRLYLTIFRKYVEKILVSLKSDKNCGHFTRRPIYVFDHISLSSS